MVGTRVKHKLKDDPIGPTDWSTTESIPRNPYVGSGIPTSRALAEIPWDTPEAREAQDELFKAVDNVNKASMRALKRHLPAVRNGKGKSPANVEPRYYPTVAAPSQPQPYRTEHTERRLSGLSAAASLAGPEAALAAGVVSGITERASTLIGSTIQSLQHPIVSITETVHKQGKRGYKTTTTSGSITTGMVLGGGLVLWVMSGGLDRTVNSFNHPYSPMEAKNLPWLAVAGPVGWGLSALMDWSGHQQTDKKEKKDTLGWWNWG